MNSNRKPKAAGNLLLSVYASKYRQSIFLTRNLVQSLEYHASEYLGEVDKAWEDMAVGVHSSQSWKPPSKDALKKLIDKRRPILKLEVKSLRPSKGKRDGDVGQRRKRIKIRIDCAIEVLIFPQQRKPNGAVFKISVPATLRTRYSTGSTLPDLEVVMKEPIVIDSHQLATAIGTDATWKRSLDIKYDLGVHVLFENAQGASAVMRLLDEPGAKLGNIPVGTRLGATWTHLPSAPADEQFLRVYSAVGGIKEKLDCRMEVQIAWKEDQGSIVEGYNRNLHAQRNSALSCNGPGRNGTTTNGRGDAEEVIVINGTGGKPLIPKVTIGMAFVGYSDYIRLDRFACPMCERQSYPSFDQLHQHLEHFHHTFKYNVYNKESRRCMELQLDYVLEVIVPEMYTEAKVLYEPRSDKTAKWLAPKRPFDIKAYLRKECTWINGDRDIQQGRRRSEMADRSSFRLRSSPSAVPDLPSRPSPRRFAMPHVPPNTRLFRLSTMRPLEEGEELSESDDNVEHGLIKTRRDFANRTSNISQDTKKLSELMNDYLEESEKMNANIYLGDALIRFTRTQGATVKAHGLRIEFEAKLRDLVDKQRIDESTIRNCNKLMDRDVNGSAAHNADTTGVPEDLAVGGAEVESDQAERTTKTSKKRSRTGSVIDSPNSIRRSNRASGSTSRLQKNNDTQNNRSAISPTQEGAKRMGINLKGKAKATNGTTGTSGNTLPKMGCVCGKNVCAIREARIVVQCSHPVSLYIPHLVHRLSCC